MNFVENIYRYPSKFPESEKWGVVAQPRTAAVAIPTNIAE
jgi:four helix bundle protein